MGKPYLHQDAHDKVTGKAKFAGDIRLPGMLYASILRPPAHGAKLKGVDLSEVKKMKDVLLVEKDDLIAVLHKYPDVAEKALKRIKAEYEMPKTGLTHTAIANVKMGKVTVWSSTQAPFPLKESLANTLNINREKIRVITPFVGGGFGGKASSNTYREALEASRLAVLTGKPIQVTLTRAEEFFYDTFRPAAVIKIKSGFDGSNKIVFWEYDVYMAGDRGADILYDVPNHLVKVHGGWMRAPEGAHPFGVGPWRAPGAGNNFHAKELHMNIMAEKAGIDPLEFRIKHLKDERMIGLLKAVADRFGYTPSKLPSGRGYGMCCGVDANTYVVHMAEVDVDKASGKIKVKRIVCGYDMGLCVNPQGTRLQMEGCCIMGMGYALTEGLRFSNGEIFDRNFDTYHIPRFSWVPKIETIIMENSSYPPQGAGEPGIVGIGAIIANGVHDATGARLSYMPMTPKRVREALQKV